MADDFNSIANICIIVKYALYSGITWTRSRTREVQTFTYIFEIDVFFYIFYVP